MKGLKKVQITRSYRINQEIRASKVRLMDVDGKQIGIVSLNEALERSHDIGVDLVEISSIAVPPVCRIMDYGKFIYEKSKLIKEQKKKQKVIQVKEIKFRPNTDQADYLIKIKNVKRFLFDKNKVKITLRFRGREIIYQNHAIELLHRICHDVNDLAVVESFPKHIEGRQMVMMLISK